MNSRFKHIFRGAVIAAAALALAGGAFAQGHRGGGGHYGGGHYVHGGGAWHGGHYGGWYGSRGPGYFWGGVGLGVGLGLAGYYASPWYAEPDYVVVDPPVVYSAPAPVPYRAVAPVNAAPVIYPRNGQTAAQTEVDSNACSQWAGSQPHATTDSSVFQRAIAACMDGRGYTLR